MDGRGGAAALPVTAQGLDGVVDLSGQISYIGRTFVYLLIVDDSGEQDKRTIY